MWVVEVVEAGEVPACGRGSGVAQDGGDQREVRVKAGGKARTVTIPKSEPPKKLVSSYVLESDGEVVKESDSVGVNYVGMIWKGAKEFDNTYSTGKTQTFPLSQVTLKGLKNGLVDKKVGSRVLLVIPPDQAFGDQQQQAIPKNSTLVFAVDILAKV